MKFTLPSNVIHIRPSLIFCLLLSTSLLLFGCATVPNNKQINRPVNKLHIQNSHFQQARNFFLEQNFGQAASILLQLAHQGHRESQYVIGYMYHYGYGVPRNEKESTRWIATAAARGHAKAQEALQRINVAHDLRSLH